MTLNRQLALLVSLVLFVLFVGGLVESIRSTKEFLKGQLQAHAQDTANSLGLTLSSSVLQGDSATVETMINAIFDSGYYRRIDVTDTSGRILIARHMDEHVETVPDWFVRSIELPAPQVESLIMDGWNEVGRLVVQSHPGYAYVKLWKNLVDGCVWFGCVWLVTLALVLFFLRVILSPLRRIEAQAEAICDRRFEIMDNVPRTRELRRVVLAMNRLARKVESILSAQSEVSEQYRAQANIDEATGLWNKRFFLAHLAKLRQNNAEHGSLSIFLIRLTRFKEYNDQFGYAMGDAFLGQWAMFLRENCVRVTQNPILARLSGADFSLVLTDYPRDETRALAERLRNGAASICNWREVGFTHSVNMGVVHFLLTGKSHEVGEILSRMDMALKSAMHHGENAWYYDDAVGDWEYARPEGKWQQILKDIIKSGHFKPIFQPVQWVSDPNRIMQLEVFARFPDDQGGCYPAGIIFATAARFGLSGLLDRMIVELLMENVGRDELPFEGVLAINLSPISVQTVEFLTFLEEILNRLPRNICRRFSFEIAELSVIHSEREILDRLRQLIKSRGSLFGLDQFGAGSGAFGYLRSLLPDYIKIDAHFVQGVDREYDNQFFVRSMIDIAHMLDILVIAPSVERDEEYDMLKSLGVDGVQGHLIGKPQYAMMTARK